MIRHEKLYKNCVNKSLLTSSDSFPKLNMNNVRGSALSPHDKNVSKTFLFSNRGFYTVCVGLLTAHLSKKRLRFYYFLKSKYIQNKKVFRTFLLLTPSYGLFILSMGKSIKTPQWR